MQADNKGPKVNFHDREITFYYLTLDEMNSLGTNTLVGDLFFGFGMMLLGAGFSVSSDQEIFWVFGGLAIVVSALFYYAKFGLIRRIKAPRKPTTESHAPNESGSELIKAEYGADGIWADVTDRVVAALKAGGAVAVSNGLAGSDPVPGVRKYLRVTYKYRGERFPPMDFEEGTTLELPFRV